MIVAKVGGSLYDWPGLRPALAAWVASQAPAPVTLFPGGGAFADAVRGYDATHRLGEAAAHRLAVRSLTVAAELLAEILQSPPAAAGGPTTILDPAPFFATLPDDLPHTWAVTTDTLALRAAMHLGAAELVLLKSINVPPGTPWNEAAARGWVDAHFPTLAAAAGVPVRIVNLRSPSPE